jgi:hypothetical protein
MHEHFAHPISFLCHQLVLILLKEEESPQHPMKDQ